MCGSRTGDKRTRKPDASAVITAAAAYRNSGGINAFSAAAH